MSTFTAHPSCKLLAAQTVGLAEKECGKPNSKSSNLSGHEERCYKAAALPRLPDLLLDIVDK
jgi:hypothetical protein